jgi:hypothetical protein
VIRLKRDADIVQIALALDAAGGLASGLHGRHQKADENADNGDHHQQFHQGKRAARA